MRPERIIVIDDSEFALYEKASALKEIGFHDVREFINPVKVLDRIKQLKPIDLLITDWKMNPIDGIELLDELRKSGELNFKTLLVSEAERPMGYEGNFLLKPTYTEDYMSQLKNVVQELLGSH